jgi:two-component system, NarL family, nitrate/nitrite response regulator NarL
LQADDNHGAVAATVLIVDDHPSFRQSARLLLESDGWEVVGEVADGHSALAAARELAPDMVLLDVQLPDLDGFEVARRLRSDLPRSSVVMTSSRDACDYGTLAVDSGACGFVAKAELTGDALEALLR